jgi:hypothetical protein
MSALDVMQPGNRHGVMIEITPKSLAQAEGFDPLLTESNELDLFLCVWSSGDSIKGKRTRYMGRSRGSGRSPVPLLMLRSS